MEICINKPMEVVWEDEIIISVVFDQRNSYDKESMHNLDRGYVWVRREDDEYFPEGGKTVVFKKKDGMSFEGYEKPAILRNKKETQTVTQNEYTDFIPYTAANFPPFPFFAKFIDTKGDTFTRKCRGSGDLPFSDLTVAVAFEKQDPLRIEAERLLKRVQDRVALADVTSIIVEVLREQGFNEKVDVNLDRMPTWFLGLMEECGIFTSAHRASVWNWYMDTANSTSSDWRLVPALARKLNNKLLSIRPWSGGGQLVITPYGHGLAVTNAKKVYWQWKAGDYRRAYGMGSHENSGGYKPHYEKRTITISPKGVEIGCQHIPHMAFTRLAERLDWPKTDPYGGY